VHIGQVEIKQDDIVVVELAQIEAFFAQIRRIDVEALSREHQLDGTCRSRLVLDQQHSHGWSPLCPKPEHPSCSRAFQQLTIGPMKEKG